MMKIVFIGGGNMASAIIAGLIADGLAPYAMTVADPDVDTRDRCHRDYGVAVSNDADAASATADVVVLAVKPQIIPAVAEALRDQDLTGKVIVSIAAGVTIARLEALFGPVAIARTMPNTPATLGLGATGVAFNIRTSADQRTMVARITQAIGISVELPREELLDAVTAVSGSGPAYVFLFMEEMIRTGESLGLTPEDARLLTVQTVLGAAQMARADDTPLADLRRRVTSPGGTTQAAIETFQALGLGDTINRAMAACRDRAVELGQQPRAEGSIL